MTAHRYLEVTYRQGRPIAAYFYLPRRDGDRATDSRKVGPGFIVDLSPGGRPIGIEIPNPAALSLDALNAVLIALSVPPASADDLRPLAA
jgi:uncharacterized protein YuzE